MKSWRLIAGVILIFILGVFVGAFGTGMYNYKFFNKIRTDSEARKSFIMKRFSNKLDLSEVQKKEIKPIIDKLEDQVRPLFKSHFTEIKKVLDQGFLEIKSHLDSDQQKKFDEMRKKFEKRMGPPPPGPPI